MTCLDDNHPLTEDERDWFSKRFVELKQYDLPHQEQEKPRRAVTPEPEDSVRCSDFTADHDERAALG